MNSASYTDNLSFGLDALRRGRPDEALPLLEAAAEGPPDARVWSALGAAHWRLGDRSRGMNAFLRAAELAPNDPTVHYNLAVVLAEEGRRSEAREACGKTLSIQHDHAGARRLLSKIQNRPDIGALHPVTGASLLNPDALELSDPEAASRTATLPPPVRERVEPEPPSPAPLPSEEESLHRPRWEMPDYGMFPWVTLLIILVNSGIFYLMERAGGSTDREVMIAYGAQFRPLVLEGQLWRFITAMFVHAGWDHILFNMLFFAFAGRWVEPFFGPARFLLLYMGAGFIGNFMTLVLKNTPTAGASGAVLGVLGALAAIGYFHRRSLPDSGSWKYGFWPLMFSLWVLYSGFHNIQTNNVAHVAGFITGIALAALFSPQFLVGRERPAVRGAVWATVALCFYTMIGMGWSVATGVDESAEITHAERKLAQGRIALKLRSFRDREARFNLKIPMGWDRTDLAEEGTKIHRWVSPMSEANVTVFTLPSPKGRGPEMALAVEQTLVAPGDSLQMRTLSREKRYLSGRVGGRIIREGRDDKGNARQAYFYFVPVNDKLYILMCTVDRYFAPKYSPVFDTIAASLRVDG